MLISTGLLQTMLLSGRFPIFGLTLSLASIAKSCQAQGSGHSIKSDILFDFTDPATNLDSWVESSDTVREVGMSKASFVVQQTRQYRRAVFFALLNPQPNGACFAGFRNDQVDFDPSQYKSIQLRIANTRGDLKRYKLLLSHGEDVSNQRDYEIFYEPRDSSCGSEGQCAVDVDLPLEDFKAYYRGKLDDNAPPLNSAPVRKFGLQVAGGVYEEDKQSGAGAMEIVWIKLVR